LFGEEEVSRPTEGAPRSPLPAVTILALGNPDRGDDGAALLASKRLEEEVQKAAVAAAEGTGTVRPAAPPPRVVAAGRPGAGLLDLLPEDGPCLLMDVVCSGSPPGTLHRIPLREINPAVLPDLRTSSHGFGPGEALALGRALGRRIPEGYFLGIEGASFGPGESPSAAVERNLADLVQAALELIAKLAS